MQKSKSIFKLSVFTLLFLFSSLTQANPPCDTDLETQYEKFQKTHGLLWQKVNLFTLMFSPSNERLLTALVGKAIKFFDRENGAMIAEGFIAGSHTYEVQNDYFVSDYNDSGIKTFIDPVVKTSDGALLKDPEVLRNDKLDIWIQLSPAKDLSHLGVDSWQTTPKDLFRSPFQVLKELHASKFQPGEQRVAFRVKIVENLEVTDVVFGRLISVEETGYFIQEYVAGQPLPIKFINASKIVEARIARFPVL